MLRKTPALLLLAGAACADTRGTPPRHDPGPSSLTQAYGINPEESARRLNNEQHVGDLNTKLHAGALPFFSDLWIQHEPTYAVVVSFKQPPLRAAVQRLAHPSIRGDILIVRAKRTVQEIARDQERATAALLGAPATWGGGYNPKTEKFEYDVETQAVADYARDRLPADLRNEVVLRVTGNRLSTF